MTGIVTSPTSRHGHRFVSRETIKAQREQSARDKENYGNKEVIRLHTLALQGPEAVPDWLVSVLVRDFIEAQGRKPSRLIVPGGKRADRYYGKTLEGIGYVGLDLEYRQGAEVPHVE